MQALRQGVLTPGYHLFITLAIGINFCQCDSFSFHYSNNTNILTASL